MTGKKHVAVIGAGPGGLTAAMLLAHRGFQVSVFEREPVVGGRNAALSLGPYTFDVGPTFLMMAFLLEEVFAQAGARLSDYCTLSKLEPMYRLAFPDKVVEPTTDRGVMRDQIAALFPGNEQGMDLFHLKEKTRYERMFPCLQKDYSSIRSMLCPELMRALPHLAIGKSLYSVLGDYFSDSTLRTAFTFQAKYLGMSPWQCPGAFTIIPYIEHAFGVYHVQGGLSRISDAMAMVARKNGADLFLNTPVAQVLTRNGTAVGVRLADGEEVACDAVVINADFGHAMGTLFPPGILRKYAPQRLREKSYSCSTFMLYLGCDRLYDEPHHTILFSGDYRTTVADIVEGRVPHDPAIYVRNASVTDPSLAPPGHSALYVLVPVPNNAGGNDWSGEQVRSFRTRVLQTIMKRTSMRDLDRHITVERIITPTQWQEEWGLYRGATFNLGHQLSQMLYFRPHNRFEEVGRCYLVGGGTHPGSGLPTIYESARISARLLENDLK